MREREHLSRLRVLGCLCVLAVAGCAVGPNYHPPQSSPPSAWYGPTTQMSLAASQQAELVHWWTTFGDSTLTSLVDRSVMSNLDLRQAKARIRQARAARGVAAGGLWPTVDATGSYTRSRSVAPSSVGTVAATGDLFHAGVDAAWELDVFGGVRRTIEAAEADLQASVEDHRDTLVTLVAEVALNYVDLRGFQQEILIAQNNLRAQQHNAELTRKRYMAGFIGALDVANANAQVATTASQIPVFEASAQQAIYSLGVLLALEPSALVEELSPLSSIPAAPPEVPMLLPADLLLRRPDVRRAEAQIHGATARIGVATADLFPRFNLTGSAGFRGDAINEWLKWSNRVWSFGPAMDWQIFSAGRVTSNIELQRAIQEEAFLAYQKVVLTAFQDVENSLVTYAKEQERRKALLEAVTANRKAVDLATQLYIQGETDFLNVLNAQRSLYVSEDALVQSTRNLSTGLVALYKALGGGWDIESKADDSLEVDRGGLKTSPASQVVP